MAFKVKTLIIAGASCILEGQAAGSEVVCLSYSHNLPRTWGDLQEALDNLLLQGCQGDGVKTFSERVLAAYHKSSDATT
jgi:hypothetical protein